jgi:D-3-phosphoglycerate dehydrogenase / 2-oxoglutarate reductase
VGHEFARATREGDSGEPDGSPLRRVAPLARRGDGKQRVTPRVLVREAIAPAGVDLLRKLFDVDVDADSDLAEIIDRYDAIVIRSATKLTADLIGRASHLKVIGRAGVGVDNVDVEAATRRGIIVANAPESTVVSAAEHTVGLLVALARNIPQAHAALKQGRWERKAYGGIELAGKTLGVLGFGRIGQQVARRAGGLGMRVIAYDPFVSADRFRELGVERVETTGDIYAAAEFLTLHLPLNAETTRSVGAAAFAQMRDGVRLINAARGELVDEPALVEALKSGKVAGAALDVFSEEPYSGPLLEFDNVVVTPHLAASTDEAQDRAGVIVAEQVAAALGGGLVTNAVNIPVIGAEELESLGPYIPLAAKLGRLAMELTGGKADEIIVTTYGGLADYDTRLLTVSALNGAFQGRADRPVNYVNAPSIARERGIEVREERSQSARDYTNLLRVEIRLGDEQTRVAGTLIGSDNRQWLVNALGFELDLELAPLLVLCRYDDVPGVIGRVGTVFGEAGVNIANMTVSRTRRGEKALMVLTVDSMPPAELVERIRAEGFDDARIIELGAEG